MLMVPVTKLACFAAKYAVAKYGVANDDWQHHCRTGKNNAQRLGCTSGLPHGNAVNHKIRKQAHFLNVSSELMILTSLIFKG